MAKDKRVEEAYRLEGKRRAILRRMERARKRKAYKESKRKGPWPDGNSSTGWSQLCDYVGICQYPCNDDC